MIPARRSTYAYRLPSRRLEHSVDAVCRWIDRHSSALAVVAVFAIYTAASTMDGRDEIRAADERTAEAQAWAAGNKVKVTLEGEPAAVSNMALQVAAAIR